MREKPQPGIITIDDLTLPSGQHEVNNIKDYGFSEGQLRERIRLA
jgi:hypothetical protein